ncbi:carbohydrate-binding domain-containing protein [Paenibacillus sp. HN-1]|nr:carbohydrate-binding domain-containing protein [Paenibacillus sp. CGMCC 1.18879]MBY9077902.1 carbohydrate-binding domain-containing protein [Paenibacillus sp. CGMCC 1.18879]MBY9088142.1 carbohydrate-binding domain-containing protein [Paenibacillus sinensis]
MKNLLTTSKKLAIVFLCAAFMAACSSNSATETNTVSSSNATVASASATDAAAGSASASNSQLANVSVSDLVTFDEDDQSADWSTENPVTISLTGSGATIEGSGTEAADGSVTITAAGTYVLSGKLTDGQIVVNVPDDGDVHLVLNGADISSSDNAAIYVKDAGNVKLTLQEGTENSVSDGKTYVLEDASSDEPDAAIFSKADLIINGTGTLNVTGNYDKGIKSKDDLKIVSGTLNIKAVDDGIVGRDMVAVNDANITVNAGGDGIKSTNDEDAEKGFVAIANGTFNITSGSDGIQAETSLVIEDGTFNLVDGGGNVNGEVKTEENGPGGMMGGMNGGGQGAASATAATTAAQTTSTSSSDTSASSETESTSMKGIKSAGDMVIKGGSFTVDSADDSVHSNSSIYIAGGTFSIATGDDGIHADTSLTIAGGTVDITKSYEGIESANITLSGGDIHVTASDDGVNAASGSSDSETGGGGQPGSGSAGSNLLSITGGYVEVNASGDGLDANGSIEMSGGTVIVYGPTNDGNGALDFDGTFTLTGGTLVAAGSAGMAQAPSDASSQYSIAMTFTETQKAGTLVHLEDGEGNEILTLAPAKDYRTVVISSPDLKKDGSYTLYSGGTSTGTEKDGVYTNGTYSGGSKVVAFSLESITTWVNESGVTTAPSGMGGGGMGGGGKGGPGGGGGMPQGRGPQDAGTDADGAGGGQTSSQ